MTPPLVGGTADPGHAAVVAIVEPRGRCDAPEQVRCSGTLIAPRVVLTAAHCLDAVRPDELEVALGADLRGVAGAAIAIQDAAIHPAYLGGADDPDLALLLLAAPAPSSVAPQPLVSASAQISPATAVTLVGYGAPADHQDGGVRMSAETLATAEGGARIRTSGAGVPCGGDSGGAVLVDTASGERLLAVIDASGAGCLNPGITTAIAPSIDTFIQPFVDAAATAPPPSRPALATLDTCGATCATVDDCPLGMLCLPESDGPHCGYRATRTVALGDPCTSGADCAAVGQGAERTCREATSCGDDAAGCGCGTSGDGGLALACLVALGLAWRARRR